MLTGTLRERLRRQIDLKEMGPERQAAITQTRFLVIGAGGIGSPALMYLAASGAVNLIVADHDEVSVSNLSRQLLHSAEDVGCNKAENTARALPRFNPEVRVTAIARCMSTHAELCAVMANADVVLDCTDNLASRQLINRCAAELRKPLVFGSALRFSGQLSVFDFRDPNSPCYRCLFEDDVSENDQKAAQYGVFTPITGLIGLLQASEAIKIAAGIGSSLVGRLLLVDLLTMDFQTIRFGKRRDCPVCSPSSVNG